MNRLLLLWSAVMMLLGILIVIAAVLQAAGTVLLLTGSLPGAGQPGEPSQTTLGFHLVLEIIFIGLGFWLFRFARKLRKALKSRQG